MFKLLLFFFASERAKNCCCWIPKGCRAVPDAASARLTLATGVVIFMMIWDCRAQLWGAGGASRVRSDSNVKELSGEVTQGLKQ